MNKVLVIVVALLALLGVVYVGGKAAKRSMVNQQPAVNYNQNTTQGDPIDNITDSQDDQSLSQISADDNADLSDNSGL